MPSLVKYPSSLSPLLSSCVEARRRATRFVVDAGVRGIPGVRGGDFKVKAAGVG